MGEMAKFVVVGAGDRDARDRQHFPEEILNIPNPGSPRLVRELESG